MKKIFIGIALFAGLTLATSCGGGQRGEVNSDTVLTREFTDSMSMALGAFMGANLQDEVRYTQNVDDYIKGYQLVAGHKFSNEELMGIRAGMFVAENFANLEAQGVEINRDLYMQEFRKYLQDKDLEQAQYAILYKNFQDFIQAVDQMLMKRDQLRQNAVAEVAETEVVEALTDSTETVVEEIEEAILTTVPENESDIVDEMSQLPL